MPEHPRVPPDATALLHALGTHALTSCCVVDPPPQRRQLFQPWSLDLRAELSEARAGLRSVSRLPVSWRSGRSSAGPQLTPLSCYYVSRPTPYLAPSMPPDHVIPSVPIVYHPAYSAPRLRAPGGRPHRFPMQVFGQIFKQLAAERIALEDNTFVPADLPSREVLVLAHAPHYIDGLLDRCLPPDIVRRIGFYEETSSPLLVDRTLAGACTPRLLHATEAMSAYPRNAHPPGCFMQKWRGRSSQRGWPCGTAWPATRPGARTTRHMTRVLGTGASCLGSSHVACGSNMQPRAQPRALATL